MKTSTIYWIVGGATVLLGGGTAVYFATRKPATAQQIGKGTNAPPVETPTPKPPPSPSYIANATPTELASFAAWLAQNPPPALDPNTGNY